MVFFSEVNTLGGFSMSSVVTRFETNVTIEYCVLLPESTFVRSVWTKIIFCKIAYFFAACRNAFWSDAAHDVGYFGVTYGRLRE